MYNSHVSFVMPVFNCADTVRESVASIMYGNFDPGDELIIVNDASTDNTGEVLQGLSAQYPGIRILNHLVNKGCAAAGRNTAIEHAKNSLIFCLDADNVLVPSTIQPLKKHLLKTGADAAAFQELRYFLYNDKPENTTHKWVFKDGVVSLADALAGAYWPGPSGNYLFTLESWLRAGRYNEFVGGAIDSWAFGIRQLATGSKMVTMPNSFYCHRYGYNSTYIRTAGKRNLSLAALEVLIPFLDLIENADMEYIMSREGRYTWFENLLQRPLRVKGYGLGMSGSVVSLHQPTESSIGSIPFAGRVKQIIRKVVGKVKATLS